MTDSLVWTKHWCACKNSNIKVYLYNAKLIKWELIICDHEFADNDGYEEHPDSDVSAEKLKLLTTETSLLLNEYELVLK
jgi:hypothetical protein